MLSFSTSASERVQYTVVFLAPREHDWSLSQLYESEVPPEQASQFRQRLGSALALQGISTAYAPTVRHMSGVVLDAKEFTQQTSLPCGVRILRPTRPCDGLPLEQRKSFLMSQGGCLLLVLSGYGSLGPVCIVAHAGRDSLLDSRYIHAGQTTRSDFSIIHAMVRNARLRGLKPPQATLRIFGGIPWQAFPHARKDSKHGKKNQELLEYLDLHYDGSMVRIRDDGAECLCMSSLAYRQAELAGIGTICTKWDLPYNGDFAYTSHQNPALSGKTRNLVVVTRK